MKNFLGASHLPILSKIMQESDGPVLELGMGYYSTPFLYWMCQAQGRNLLSLESDKKWMDKLEYDGGDAWFNARHVQNWDSVIDALSVGNWSVILIDHRPALQRHKDIIRLKDSADYIVIHDTEPEIDKFYAYRRVWKHFKYIHHFRQLKPNTSVVSNKKDLSWLKN